MYVLECVSGWQVSGLNDPSLVLTQQIQVWAVIVILSRF